MVRDGSVSVTPAPVTEKKLSANPRKAFFLILKDPYQENTVLQLRIVMKVDIKTMKLALIY